jgi:spore germination cell wall hydrolase CwlJ-like protein
MKTAQWLYRLSMVIMVGVLIYALYQTYLTVKWWHNFHQQHQQMEQTITDQSGKITELERKEKFYEDIVVTQQNEIAAKAAAKKAKADFVASELRCLADNTYAEAGFEPADGQLAVATVVMNRVVDPQYPKTVCGVVYERHLNKMNNKIVCQFSWTCKPRHRMATAVYKSIMEMVKGVYFKHVRSDEVADATLYHADYIQTPNWATDETKLAQIGHHIFYSH